MMIRDSGFTFLATLYIVAYIVNINGPTWARAYIMYSIAIGYV